MARDLMSSKKNRSARASQPSRPAASKTKTGNTVAGFGSAGTNMDGVDMQQVNSVVDSMRGKNEQEMQDELFRVADEQFKAGNVNIDDIDAFAKQAAGMLNAEQQKKLNMLTGMLKNKARN